MLKGLEGVQTHEHREWVPILANDQDMPRLAGRLREALETHPAAHAVLLAGHGMYTWARAWTKRRGTSRSSSFCWKSSEDRSHGHGHSEHS